MGRRRVIWLVLALLLAGTLIVLPHVQVNAAGNTRPVVGAPVRVSPLAETSLRPGERARPALSNEAYIRPEFGRQMRVLRPTILAAARRHNRQELSGMNDREFAVVIAALLYNEQFGWLEEEVRPIRRLTPFYESLQVQANNAGANLSVWPANLRPSVAAEILQHRVPVPPPTVVITRPLHVAGSKVDPRAYDNQSDLYAAITREIATPSLAVEYLATNLERGLYRAAFERVPMTWRTLAVWHNQGVVAPRDVVGNSTAEMYVRRTSAYLPAARRLVAQPAQCNPRSCTPAEQVATAGEGLLEASHKPRLGTPPATIERRYSRDQAKGTAHAR